MLLVLTSGCGTEDPGSDAVRTDAVLDHMARADVAPDTPADVAGEAQSHPELPLFAISLSESCDQESGECWAYATANGRFAATGIAPGEIVTVGDCVFFRPALPADCVPQCEPGTVCDYATGDCRAPIPPVSAGEITVTGLKSALTIIPETQYYYYIPHFDPEPVNGDIFDGGTVITAMAPGADTPAFEVQGLGVAEVETELPCDLEIETSKDLVVEWTPGTQGDSMLFEMRSGNHANQFSSIVCATTDSGELVVDKTLLQEYALDSRPVEVRSLTRVAVSDSEVGGYRIRVTASTSTSCSMWEPPR